MSSTSDLLEAMQIIFSGADVRHIVWHVICCVCGAWGRRGGLGGEGGNGGSYANHLLWG